MEDILELFGTIILEILSGVNYKKPKTRTWVMTAFFTLLAGILVSYLVWNAVELLHQENTVGFAVVVALALAALIVSAVIIIRGHRNDWVHF